MLNHVHNQECVVGMRERLPDESVDCIITSPPYNVGIKYDSWNDKLAWVEYETFMRAWLTEAYRVLKSDGRIALNIPYEINIMERGGRLFFPAEYWKVMKEIGFQFAGIIDLGEDTPERTKNTAWGSWLSASAPYIYNAKECIIIAYKKKWKKEKEGKSTITKEEFMNLVKGIWTYHAETRGLTQANYSLDIPLNALKILTYENDIVLDPFMGCYDDETEVLTEHGWKKFFDVLEGELICSLNPSNMSIEFVRFVRRQKYYYDGPMYSIRGRSVSLLITPNHNIYVREHHQKEKKIARMDKFSYRQFYFYNQGINNSAKSYHHDMLKLWGFWIGDGYSANRTNTNRGYRIGFNLKKERKKKYLETLLFNLNLNYKKYVRKDCFTYSISSALLYSMFYGKSHTKRVPDFVFKLDVESISSFIEGYSQADGYGGQLYSCNKNLLDDIQILFLLSGRSGIVRSKRCRTSTIGGRKIFSREQYVFSAHKNQKQLKLNWEKNVFIIEKWAGNVNCLTLECNHVMYVRREGKPVWCGNSGTTAEACIQLNRNYIGFEISPNYCDKMKVRTEQGRL